MEMYLIQVMSFQALLFGLYWLFFRKITFFTAHRFYLLLMPVIAILLPFIKINAFQSMVPETFAIIPLPEVILGTVSFTETATDHITSRSTVNLWSFYTGGVLLSIFFFAYRLRRLLSFFQYRVSTEYIIQIPQSTEAFTFLKYIFIGSAIDPLSRKHILTHEKIHATQKHTWDLLFFELLRILMWFNPMVYIYQREIARVHEYIADQALINQTTKKEYYEKLLNTAFGTVNLSFTNTFFNHSFIKNRISMLQKSKSKKIELVKYVFLIPMILGMLLYVSCSEDSSAQDKTQLSDQASLLEYQKLLENSEDGITQQDFTFEMFESYKEFRSLNEKSIMNGTELNTDELMSKLEIQSNLKQKGLQIVDMGKGNYKLERVDRVFDISSVAQAPIFPGCETNVNNDERKKCLSEGINNIVIQNFDTSLGDKLGLVGQQRIYCLFKIDSKGKISDIKVRAPHPELKKEAERVLKILPPLESGKALDGTPVKVSYVLPILFKIEE